MMAILFVTFRLMSFVMEVDILTTQEREFNQFTLLVCIVRGEVLMQPKRREAQQFSFSKFVLIGEPYRITANEILIEKIDVVCGQEHL